MCVENKNGVRCVEIVSILLTSNEHMLVGVRIGSSGIMGEEILILLVQWYKSVCWENGFEVATNSSNTNQNSGYS